MSGDKRKQVQRFHRTQQHTRRMVGQRQHLALRHTLTAEDLLQQVLSVPGHRRARRRPGNRHGTGKIHASRS